MRTRSLLVLALGLWACGKDAAECPGGGQKCDGRCVDTKTDENNCGMCGNACYAWLVCVNGGCVCPNNQATCSAPDAGIDASTDLMSVEVAIGVDTLLSTDAVQGVDGPGLDGSTVDGPGLDASTVDAPLLDVILADTLVDLGEDVGVDLPANDVNLADLVVDTGLDVGVDLSVDQSPDVPPNPCGNGVLDPGERCDDGVNAGLVVGDCAPDCSTRIVKRFITYSSNQSTGNIKKTAASAVAGADALCPSGYKALFSDGVNRIASVTANAGDGQVDWVLRPWTAYHRPGDDVRVGTTTATALLPIPLAAIPAMGNAYWTGLNADWTSLGAPNCLGWTSELSTVQTSFGNGGYTTGWFLKRAANTCDLSRSVYCVEAPKAACPTTGTTTYVDQAMGTDAEGFGFGPGECAMRTITYAIAKGQPRIEVAKGTYSAATGETFPLTLEGTRVLWCMGATITGSGTYLTNTTLLVANGTNNEIRECNLVAPGASYVMVWNSTGGGILGNQIKGSGGAAVSVRAATTIDGNSISNAGYGLHCYGCGGGTWTNNAFSTISGNDISCSDATASLTGSGNTSSQPPLSCGTCVNCPF